MWAEFVLLWGFNYGFSFYSQHKSQRKKFKFDQEIVNKKRNFANDPCLFQIIFIMNISSSGLGLFLLDKKDIKF